MAVDGERIFRAALEEPAPPDPPETVEERFDGDGHRCIQPVLMVFPDGGLAASNWAGTLLLGWFAVATFVTVIVGAWWVVTTLSTAGLAALLSAAGLTVGMLVGWLTDRKLPRREDRR